MITHSPEETQEVGAFLGSRACVGDVFLLIGDLGAGKTCLTQGIARGLGVKGYVRSPSFVIATRYPGRLALNHVDLYRIEDPVEAWDLGLEEMMAGDGLCVVEWAERASELFPPHSLWINLDYGEAECDRIILFRQGSARQGELLEELSASFREIRA